MLSMRVLVAVLAGVGAAVAFEPVRLVYLLPLAVAAVTLACRGLTMRKGFLVGAAFGTAFMLALLPWLRVIGADAWLLLSLLEGLFYGLLGAALVAVGRLPGWPAWAAACWVAVEALRDRVPFGGFPWGRLGFATVDTVVAPAFGYVGAAGVSFAVALLGSVLAWALLVLRRSPLASGSALAATVLLLSAASLLPADAGSAAAGDRRANVAAVQGNVPGEGMTAFSERRAVLNNHVEATRRLARRVASGAVARPDLVIWPENSTDIDPFADPTVYADIQAAVDAVGVPVLVGAMVSGPGPAQVRNQGIVWRPGAGPGERYAKRHPVPFGEYIPFRDLLSRFVTRLSLVPRDMVPGTSPGVLDLGAVRIGDVICFEIAYDSLVRDVVRGGATLLVVQTNNATYMGTGQIEQQFAISRLRAIETGRYVVVAATNGISGIVAPDGQVLRRAVPRTQQVLLRSVGLRRGLTPGVRWGGLVELLLSTVAALSVVAGSRRSPRRGPPPGHAAEEEAWSLSSAAS